MLTKSEPKTAPLRIVFNLESLLIDTVAGIRHALNAVARTRRKVWLHHPLTQQDLGSQTLSSVIAEIAGCNDPVLINELIEHYWRVYRQESRFRAPLLPGARDLVEQLGDLGAELHYISTWGPTVATQFVQQHGLHQDITTIFTPPSCACPCVRAGLLENFVKAHSHPAESYLLLSDSLAELQAAQRLRMPALALGYGQTSAPILELANGLIGVADSVADVGLWIQAQTATTLCLRDSADRRSFTLH